MSPVDRADSITGMNFVFRSHKKFQPGRLTASSYEPGWQGWRGYQSKVNPIKTPTNYMKPA